MHKQATLITIMHMVESVLTLNVVTVMFSGRSTVCVNDVLALYKYGGATW